jgi:hypothetical protein
MNSLKVLVASLMLFACVTAESESTFVKADYYAMARPAEGQGYIATIVLGDGKCSLIYESMGFTPTILGAVVTRDHLDLLIKARWTGSEEISPDEKYPTKYYVVRITEAEVSQKVSDVFALMDLDLPSRQLAAFEQLFAVTTNGDAVNVRDGPGLNAKRIGQVRKGMQLRVLDIADVYDRFQNKFDFWYRISGPGIAGWVFGYYLDGVVEFNLPKD